MKCSVAPRFESRSADPVEMLHQILFTRRFEEAVLRLRRENHFSGSVHLCVGQESVPVAMLANLDSRDRVLSTYRGHGWALACGAPPAAVLAEILGRETGTNGGRAGSAYLSAPEHGFIGENSIVGASAPIANGIAMGLLAEGRGGVSVVSMGDGATNQGAVHEAIVFAIARQLPVIFVCENNRWSEMTPISNTVPKTTLSARAAAYGLPALPLNGSDVRGLQAALSEVVQKVRAGGGPAFVEVDVPRILGHYNSDIQHYRTAADRSEHLGRDPLALLSHALLSEGALSERDWAGLQQSVADDVGALTAEAIEARQPDPLTATRHVAAVSPQMAIAPLPAEGASLTYSQALNRALRKEFEVRPGLVSFGEDIGVPGGTFGVTRDLRRDFGERIFDTPISESAILGAALGASLEGLTPVVEIMWTDFLLVALDQVANQMANVRYLSRGAVNAPLVVRMQQGATPGSCAQHSQCLEAVLAHIPGIKVGLPSNPHDAYAMLRAAVADPDPVILIESRALYQMSAPVDVERATESVGGSRLRRRGSQVLVVTWGRMVEVALSAAQQLADEGISAAVLDLRWLCPLDEESIVALVRQLGKMVVVHEANVTGGFGGEIAARISNLCFAELKAPIVRVGMPDVRVPSSPALQSAVVPDSGAVVQAVRRLATWPTQPGLSN
ncbi:alpha-ketoacid dehydrogenase subunit alpha/beta [Ramlibacter sp.]|uniref:alpha-ketoacid dehydrogenase subunit alpha/beta n=1 Tax=Ramlibacter sp. TaxID=1917967 RepID=UPI003D10C9C7